MVREDYLGRWYLNADLNAVNKPAVGQFGEKLVKMPQNKNEPGICKTHTHTVSVA